MLWDKENLYIYAELEEPDLWGTLRQHDTVIYDDNDFEIFINPNNDTHNYFELEINALGTEMDLFLPKPYRNGGQCPAELGRAGVDQRRADEGNDEQAWRYRYGLVGRDGDPVTEPWVLERQNAYGRIEVAY